MIYTNQKGYCLYDLRRMKVIHSRDVFFNETSMPGVQKEKELPPKYVELEVEEKPVTEESVTPNTTSSVAEEIPVDEPSGEESASANVPSNQTPNLRRSTRNRRIPDWHSHNLTLLSTVRQTPPQ